MSDDNDRDSDANAQRGMGLSRFMRMEKPAPIQWGLMLGVIGVLITLVTILAQISSAWQQLVEQQKRETVVREQADMMQKVQIDNAVAMMRLTLEGATAQLTLKLDTAERQRLQQATDTNRALDDIRSDLRAIVQSTEKPPAIGPGSQRR